MKLIKARFLLSPLTRSSRQISTPFVIFLPSSDLQANINGPIQMRISPYSYLVVPEVQLLLVPRLILTAPVSSPLSIWEIMAIVAVPLTVAQSMIPIFLQTTLVRLLLVTDLLVTALVCRLVCLEVAPTLSQVSPTTTPLLMAWMDTAIYLNKALSSIFGSKLSGSLMLLDLNNGYTDPLAQRAFF
jgi:hypothetical protein